MQWQPLKLMTLKEYIYICDKTENSDQWGVQNIQEYNCKICVQVLMLSFDVKVTFESF